ncbi:tetratricopeptide repeat protein [Candidatus Kuenenia stuttgartiensis]|uniref:tetratricopeptide repeat protein n=1 Tax=Kuenenia stuttgartiensis TaxID=174633 RepID=UPI00146DE1AE|nr:tetratricopeptide repeat protein [Candidatus Kuenenia stuttgartiensis]
MKLKFFYLLLLLSMVCISFACGKREKHIERANTLAKENKLEEALSEYTKAIESDKSSEIAYYGRGDVYFKLGKLEDAAKDFRSAIDIKPGFIEAHKKLAETFDKIGAPPDEFQKRIIAIEK